MSLPKGFAAWSGVGQITSERIRQIEKGYTPEHDDAEHTIEDLFRIASCYMDYAANELEGHDQDSPHPFWPDTSIPWKPEDLPIQNAVKGAAFAAAAIDLMYLKLGASGAYSE